MPFVYRNDHLSLTSNDGSVSEDLLKLARSNDGPIYVYDLSDIQNRALRLKRSFGALRTSIHYAMKANANREILSALAAQGLGVDTVSGGEVREALEAGFKPEAIIFSGVGKTRGEIEFAVQSEIKQINVESPQELERIGEIARKFGKIASVAFRMNPDVNPKTHPYITTGFRENKFGMDEAFLPELKEILETYPDSLRLRGVTLHIGSQLTEISSMREAITKTIVVYKRLVADGFALDRFDIGGGLGIDYDSGETESEFKLIEEYGLMVQELLSPLACEILTEPGRILVARSGVLIGEVQYIKKTEHKKFVILNTGMNHLLRPALYQAKHRVLPLISRANVQAELYDVVGPICESSDFFLKDVTLPTVRQGDFVALADSGAYGFSMASKYNRHELPKELVLKL